MTSVLVYFDAREDGILKNIMRRFKLTQKQATVRKIVREFDKLLKERDEAEDKK